MRSEDIQKPWLRLSETGPVDDSAGRIALFLVGIFYEGCSIGGRTALGEAGYTAQGIGRQMCRIIEFDARFGHRFGRRMETAPIGARQLFVLAIALSCDDLRHRRQLRGFLRSRIDE